MLAAVHPPNPSQAVTTALLGVGLRPVPVADVAAISDQEPGEGWPVQTLEDWPRSVRVDISLGTEGGEPPVEHGPYYVRRSSGAVMESGIAYSLGLSRASASTEPPSTSPSALWA